MVSFPKLMLLAAHTLFRVGQASCVGQLSITITNTLPRDNHLIKRQGLFWLSIPEVSVQLVGSIALAV